MIKVKSLNNCEFYLNHRLIEKIELIPETKITLTSGKYYLVVHTAEEVVDKILEYDRRVAEDKITKGAHEQ